MTCRTQLFVAFLNVIYWRCTDTKKQTNALICVIFIIRNDEYYFYPQYLLCLLSINAAVIHSSVHFSPFRCLFMMLVTSLFLTQSLLLPSHSSHLDGLIQVSNCIICSTNPTTVLYNDRQADARARALLFCGTRPPLLFTMSVRVPSLYMSARERGAQQFYEASCFELRFIF